VTGQKKRATLIQRGVNPVEITDGERKKTTKVGAEYEMRDGDTFGLCGAEFQVRLEIERIGGTGESMSVSTATAPLPSAMTAEPSCASSATPTTTTTATTTATTSARQSATAATTTTASATTPKPPSLPAADGAQIRADALLAQVLQAEFDEEAQRKGPAARVVDSDGRTPSQLAAMVEARVAQLVGDEAMARRLAASATSGERDGMCVRAGALTVVHSACW
jgi:hypothetical protein